MKYRKKPVVIEAYQLPPDWREDMDWPPWLHEAWNKLPDETGAVYPHAPESTTTLWVNTAEGPLKAKPGDWLIRGVEGELYPCKPSVFEATYEPVEEPDQAAEAAEEQDR